MHHGTAQALQDRPAQVVELPDEALRYLQAIRLLDLREVVLEDLWPMSGTLSSVAPQRGPEKRCRAKIVEKCRKTF